MSSNKSYLYTDKLTTKDSWDLLRQVYKSSKGILHLGAHKGQEAANYLSLKKPVVWVEAMPDVYQELKQYLVAFPNQKGFCALLGDCNGKQNTFYISNNSGGVS